MSEYLKAEEKWEQVQAPLREAALKAALAEQKELKRRRELAELTESKPPVEKSGVEVGPAYDWEREARSQGLDERARSQLKRDGWP